MESATSIRDFMAGPALALPAAICSVNCLRTKSEQWIYARLYLETVKRRGTVLRAAICNGSYCFIAALSRLEMGLQERN